MAIAKHGNEPVRDIAFSVLTLAVLAAERSSRDSLDIKEAMAKILSQCPENEGRLRRGDFRPYEYNSTGNKLKCTIE